jgi:23S rRNA (uracil1939-C5)-methyltransferase
MQHVEFTAQVAIKQRVLEDNLKFIGKVRPSAFSPRLPAPPGITVTAPVGTHGAEKGGVLVGFTKSTPAISPRCVNAILPKHISDMIMPLRARIAKLSINSRMRKWKWP